MANFSYKKTTTNTLKVAGLVDCKSMTINADGEEMKISDLLKQFNEEHAEIQIKTKDDEELTLTEADDE